MFIHSLTAVYGRLKNDTLRLQNGLNILEAPNETGKSTWCAFLTAMLYGVNSRERDRAGFIADKNRYAPWDGSAMAGRMECLAGGQELTLTRSTRRPTAPMAEFQAVYSGSGSTVDGLTGINCGETLLGVTREVFERSAFIRQSGLPITQDTGLERRVASLISSGEEGTSYSEAYAALKQQLTRRRFNKSGQLPALEAQLAEIQQQCTAAESIRNQLTQAQQRAQLAETSAAALQAELATHDRWDAAQKRAQLANLTAQADAAAQAAQQQATALAAQRIPDMETIGRLRGAIVNLETTRKSAEKARAERDQALKALLLAEKDVNESPFAGQTAEEARQDISAPPPIVGRTPASLAAFFGMLALGTALTMLAFARYGAFLSGWMRTLPWLIFSVMTAGGAALSQLICRHAAQSAHLAALQKRFGTADPAVLNALADAYGRALESRDHAQADANAKSAAAEALNSTYTTNEQAILLEVRRFAPAAFHAAAADQALRSCAQQRKALSDAQAAAAQAAARRDLFAQQVPPDSVQEAPLLPPRRSRVEVADALQQAQAELSAARSAADQLSGRLHAMGDPVLLQSAAERLQSQIAQLETEYDALRLAMDTLTGANTTLQNRFSPQLSRRTSEIFQQLTGGRYTAAALDRSFRLTARPEGDPIDRDIQLLSAGTADQLYLAARLAICQLVLPEETCIPIILDDALANFDDARCAAALRWLKQASRHRQILLFTCHSREAAFFAADSEVSVQHLH